MKKPRSTATDFALDLRQQAEAIAAPEATTTDAEIRKLLHELRVHRIELELQNVELREARADCTIGRFAHLAAVARLKTA
jgi:hypothetical protein